MYNFKKTAKSTVCKEVFWLFVYQVYEKFSNRDKNSSIGPEQILKVANKRQNTEETNV